MPHLISVIVPAYNAASRIKFSLESIISQDYENIEIIVVDDASTDNTGKIAREILSSSSRPFKIITHEHNRGECASRNTGLENSGGDYVLLMDADDMAEKNFISCLYSLIIKYNCNVSFCGRVDRFTDGKKDIQKPINIKPPYIRTGEEILYLRLRDIAAPHMCAVMMNRKFIEDNGLKYFDGTCWAGDVEFQIKVFCCADKIAFSDKCLYIYMHHSEMGSLSGVNTNEKKIRRYEVNTGASERTAEFLLEHSNSERIKKFTENILMPQNIIRKFTLSAMKNDKNEYNSNFKNINDIKILRRALSFYTFRQKPEAFFKALMIMFIPSIYYRMRSKF